MAKNISTESAELCLALEWDFIGLPSVIAWADELIISVEDVDDRLIDLSLCDNKKDAISILKNLTQSSEFWPAAKKNIKRILEQDNLQPKQALHYAKLIHDLGEQRDDAPSEIYGLMHHWAYIDLAIHDGGMMSPEEAVVAFLDDIKGI